MGMPALLHDNWTVDMLDALPDDLQRYEIIDGVLYVTPAPSDGHQFVSGEFYVHLHEYLLGSSIARPLHSPADVRRGDRTRNRVQPDVFVVRLKDGKRPTYPYGLGDLLLIIEVQSPSNPTLDYQVKRRLYLKEGVPEYWIANPEARVVSRWTGVDDPGEVLSERIEWRAPGAVTPMMIDVKALFEEALR